MSQTYEICTTNSSREQQQEPPSPRSTLPSLLYRRKKALEETQKFHEAEIERLQHLLIQLYKIISATKTHIKDASRGLKQVELSIINVQEDMQIQGERNAHYDNSDLMHNTAEAALSPPDSMETDTPIASGDVWRGCACPSHQAIYDEWPKHNAVLTIAQCMRTCVYCGSDFEGASELRKHMKREKYARRNLSVKRETQRRYSSTTPAWNRISIQRLASET